MKVAILGASDNPERYSRKAFDLLRQKGHEVYPVHPKLTTIEGVRVYPSLKDVPVKVDTVTLYVSPEISSKLGPEILAASPRRIIFNPGAENPGLTTLARENGIETVEACSLVLLTTGRF